jgi:hypothetical protein
LSNVFRRSSVIAVAAVAALTGCATFQNTDTVAKVGSAELTQAEFERRAESLGFVTDDRLSGDDARATIGNWIGLELADAADILDAYLNGPVESGITCVFGLAAPDVDTADAWLARLEDGESWEDLAAEVAPDTPNAGRTGCLPTESVAPVADQMADMRVDDPYRVLNFGDGSVVLVRMQSRDDINGYELLQTASVVEPSSLDAIFAELEELEVEVSPRYGTFDRETVNVIPLG